MKRSDFRFLDRLRVRWSEIDSQQIVFNGHYLGYFDTAIAGYWRALAMPYHQTMAGLGGDLYVRKATLEYLASARYDDLLDIGMRCERIGASSITFQAAAFRQERLLVGGELVYVFADPPTQTSRPVPDALRECLLGFEAGEAMAHVSTGSWSDLKPLSEGLRQAVFVDEQRIATQFVWDDNDEAAVHGLVVNRFGQALATGRLLQQSPQIGRIGRMAVHQAVRGSRIGRQLLDALMEAACARGDTEVLLHAQASAIPFYLRSGFVPQGEMFVEAGIDHLAMSKRVRDGLGSDRRITIADSRN